MTRFVARLTLSLAVTVALSLLGPAVSAKAETNKEPANMDVYGPPSVKQGEGLLLECKIHHPWELIVRLFWEISFLKKNKRCAIKNATVGSRNCMGGRARMWWSGNSNYLYVNSTQQSDNGSYSCTVKGKTFKLTTETKTVVVYVGPERVTITGLERGWVVADHKKVNVTCHVDNVYPVPKILWVINGQPSNKSGTFTSERTGDTFQVESRLKLEVPQQSDQLRVTCLVANTANASDVWNSTSAQAEVYNRPSVSVEPLERTAPREGSTLTLVCRVKDAKPPEINKYVWKRNEIKLTVAGYLDRLKLTSLNASRDDGNYTCRAKNEAGISPPMTAPYVLKVQYAPVLQVQMPTQVQEGQSVHISCNLIGAEPAPVSLIRWNKNGVEFTISSRSQPLVIDNVKASYSGNYSCSRRNSVGRGESPAVALLVEYAPRGQAVITVPYGTVVITGAMLRLRCDPPEDSGHPAVTWYEWTVQGGETDRFNTSSNRWETRTHSVTQSGNYRCRVGNRVGASEFSPWLEVTVQAPVEIEEPKQEVTIVATRDDFRINCTASGSHITMIKWQRDEQDVVLDHFEVTRTMVQGRGYAHGQTQATMSSLTWRNHSATCDQLDKLSGRYTCVVTGQAASFKTTMESAGIELDLQYSAMWNDKKNQEMTAAPGDKYKVLTCDTCANPPPSIHWTYKEGALPEGVDTNAHKLTIPVVKQQHFGQYQCVVNNKVAGHEQLVKFPVSLTERGPPHVPEGAVVASRTSRTLRVQWYPGYHGGFPPQWFVLKYKADGDDSFTTFSKSIPVSDSVNATITETVTGLQPDTQYTLLLFARNSRPSSGRTESNHSHSGYVILHTKTRPRPSVEVDHVTIAEDHMMVEWVYDSNGPARRRRSTAEPESVSVVVHYRKHEEDEVTYPPDAPASTLPASVGQARINGTFDVATPYSVWLAVYEGPLHSHSTGVFQQMPSLDGGMGVWGVVGAIMAGVLLISLVLFVFAVWRCRRRTQKDRDVELVPSSSTSSPSGYNKVPQSEPKRTNGTNDPSGEAAPEEKIKKPPRRKKKKPVTEALLTPESDTSVEVKKVKPPQMRKRRPQPAEPAPPPEPEEPLYQNSPRLRRASPDAPQEEEPLYDNVARSVPEPLYANVDTADQEPSQPVEEESMVYADLTFMSPRDSQPIVIHQEDDAVEYTTIDFTKRPT